MVPREYGNRVGVGAGMMTGLSHYEVVVGQRLF